MIFISYIVDLFRSPAIFISLIAFFGLIIQGKSFSDIIKGTFKTMMGVLILLTGVDVIGGSMTPLSNAIVSLFDMPVSKELADYGVFIGEFGFDIGVVMVLGFLFNILIAKVSRFKTVFMTGHMMFYYAMLFLAVGIGAGFDGLLLYGFSIFCYLISTILLPWLLVKDIKDLTKEDNFSIGHSAALFCYLGARYGSLFKKSKYDLEVLKLPSYLGFLKETTIFSSLVMIFVYTCVYFMVGEDIRISVYGVNALSSVLTLSMTFGAGLFITLQGTRLMMVEIVPAFKGISDRLVKGAIPALDIPLVFPYGPNSLVIGFLISLISSLVTMFIINMSGFSAFAILPATIACYFDVAPSAIFANNKGGAMAAISWSFICGVLMMVFVCIGIPIVGDTVGTFVQSFGANEESIWLLLFSKFAEVIKFICGLVL